MLVLKASHAEEVFDPPPETLEREEKPNDSNKQDDLRQSLILNHRKQPKGYAGNCQNGDDAQR
jgi:hypothetical protein